MNPRDRLGFHGFHFIGDENNFSHASKGEFSMAWITLALGIVTFASLFGLIEACDRL